MNRTLNSLEFSKRHSVMPTTIASVAPRNPYANHPLMRKNAVHEKSKSAERSKTRRETKQLARDWSTHFSVISSSDGLKAPYSSVYVFNYLHKILKPIL